MGLAEVMGGGAVTIVSPAMLLNNIMTYIAQERRRMIGWKWGMAVTSPSRFTLILHPEFAMELNRLSFTRKGLQQYLYERTSVLYEELNPEEIEAVKRRIETGEIPNDRIPVFKEALKVGGRVPLLDSPKDIQIIVAGGIPGYTLGMRYFSRPIYTPTGIQTKLIRGATLTKGGR